MRISGPHGSPLPAPTAPGRARETAAAPQATEFAGPAEAEAPAEAPAEAKSHGLVGAAEHSHRSDVAALRQWINHPDLRAELPVPDLTAEHKGNGFQKAVAAYQAAAATGTPTPPADPAPVVTDPAPVVTDPAPVVTDPAPVVTDPAPVVSDPAPVVTDPAPVVSDPAPVVTEPAPVVLDPAQVETAAAPFVPGATTV